MFISVEFYTKADRFILSNQFFFSFFALIEGTKKCKHSQNVVGLRIYKTSYAILELQIYEL